MTPRPGSHTALRRPRPDGGGCPLGQPEGTGARRSFWLEGEVKPRLMLEEQTASLAIGLPPHDDDRGGEADDDEVAGELARVPHVALPVLRLQFAAGPRVGVDGGRQLAALYVCVVLHGCSFRVGALMRNLAG